MAKAKKPRTQAAAVRQARRTPDRGPDRYRATVYHEIETDCGTLRVEPGHIVVETDDGVEVMPPETYARRYPKLPVRTKHGH